MGKKIYLNRINRLFEHGVKRYEISFVDANYIIIKIMIMLIC